MTASPTGPWPRCCKAYAGVRDTDSAGEVLARIGEATAKLWAAGAQGDDAARAAAMLAYTLGVTDPRAPAESTDPRRSAAGSHAAWRAFFSALASSGPVVVLVEDIHWADPALLDLLDESANASRVPSCSSCVASRPGRDPARLGRRPAQLAGRARWIPCRPTTPGRLVGLLLVVDGLPGPVYARILERAEGNPFFLEEILRRLIDEGLLRREPGRWRAAPGIEAIELPDSVQGVLASRIDLLAPADKRVLQAAAVVGRVFWREPLRLLTAGLLEGPSSGLSPAGFPADPASAGPPAERALEESLRRLEARDLVSAQVGSAFAGQPEYLFRHVLTRDVAYDGIPRRERGAAHAQVARWLERTAGERAPEFGELLAHHYATAAASPPKPETGAIPACGRPPSSGSCAPQAPPSPSMCSARPSALRTTPWSWPKATSSAAMP